VDPLMSILRSWSLLAGGQVVSSLISLIVMVIASRTLGDVAFGRLYLAWSLTLIAGVVVDLGLSQVIARAVARTPALSGPYLRRAALVLALLGGCIYFLLLGATTALGYAEEVRFLVAILGVRMVAEGAAQLLGAFFQAHERMLVPSVARVAGSTATLVLVVPLLANGHGAAAVAIVMVVGAALRVVLQAAAVGRLSGFSQLALKAPEWRTLISEGFPFMTAAALGMLVYKIDVVVLGAIASEATVGWYGAASRVSDAMNVIPLVLTTATFPVLSRLWVGPRNDFNVTARKTLELLVIVTVPVAITLLLFADRIVNFLFTASYASAVPVLQIHALSLALVFVDNLFVCVLMATGRERSWIVIVGAACVLIPALNWILVPAAGQAFQNGAIGAALAKLLTEAFILAAAFRAMPAGVLGAENARITLRALGLGAALAVILIACRFVGVPWLLAAVVGVSAYFAAALRFGLLPTDILRWIGAPLVRRLRPVVTARSGEPGAPAERPQSVDAA
jgi:O-antigen/teichoic acid export membrane protein